MKKILAIFAVLISLSASSAITIDAVYLSDSNPFCYSDYKTLYIVVTESSGETVTINNVAFTNNHLEATLENQSTIGFTTTFEYDVFVSWSTPPAAGTMALEDIIVTATNVSMQTDVFSLMNVQVVGAVLVDFNVSDIIMCSNGLPFDLNQYVVQPGGEFSWIENLVTSEISNSNILDPIKSYPTYVASGGDFYIDYTITDIYGCQGTNTISTVYKTPPNLIVTSNPSTCGGATGSAIASINGTSDVKVYWSNGFTEIISGGTGNSTITNLSSGVYYINIKDTDGCKNVAKANISDSDFIVSAIENPVLCAGANGSVALSISVTTGSVNNIFWSNGHTTPTLTAAAGEYSVEIHTTANCNYFGTYTIADSALKVKLDNVYDNSSCFFTPDGSIFITTKGGSGVGTYAWDWTKNGSPSFATSEDLPSISGGVYQCTVTDANSCSLTWSKTIGNYNNVFLSVSDLTKPTCGNTDGAIDILIDTWGDIPTAYSWSNGATTEDLTGVLTGNYTLTYTDQAGCTSYLTVKLPNEKPYQPSICLLTVDTSLIYNQIVWEKDINQNVDGFKVYRETSTYGVFEKVATRNYALESFFEDNAASPVDRSWRYFITSYDACGQESYGSFIHKTIHVVSNTTNSIDYTVSWDDYEGINYTSVDVYRFDNTNGWTNIDNVLYGTNSTMDTPPVLAGLDYMISFNLSATCTSTKAQDHNSSRSNKTAAIFNAGGSTAYIEDIDLGLISIYPNPTNATINIHLDNPELFNAYEIVDLNGRVVASGILYSNNTIVDLYDVSSGVYMMRLLSTDKIVTEKFIKN